jgi:hypothetical protein
MASFLGSASDVSSDFFFFGAWCSFLRKKPFGWFSLEGTALSFHPHSDAHWIKQLCNL